MLEKETGTLLRINTTIRNDGDPAYNAQLFVSYPPSINFVGKEPTVSDPCERRVRVGIVGGGKLGEGHRRLWLT